MAVELVTMAMSKSGPRSNRGPPAALVSELLLSDWSAFDSASDPVVDPAFDPAFDSQLSCVLSSRRCLQATAAVTTASRES